MLLPTINDVITARHVLANYMAPTPLLYSPLFEEKYRISLYVKADNLTETGAFKIRGALYAMSQLTPEQLKAGVVAFSTGNHAQAVAYAAKLLGTNATIIMPNTASAIKIHNTKAYGATVILFDPKTESREEIARSYSQLHFIHPYDDFNVIAGQGVAGMECVEQLKQYNKVPDSILIQVSGGGYMAGFNTAISHYFPNITLYGVESIQSSTWQQSLKYAAPTHIPIQEDSICDAILPPKPKPGNMPWAILKESLQTVFALSDNDALKGMACAAKHFGLVAEPSGAITLGAIMQNPDAFVGQTIITTISGRNTNKQCLQAALEYFDEV